MLHLIFRLEKNATGVQVTLQRSAAGVPHPEEEKFASVLEKGYCAFMDRHIQEQQENEAQARRIAEGN